MKRRAPRLSYANVVATLALFLVVAGGTAFAAVELGKESVGTKELKKGAVTGSKLSKGAKKRLTGLQGQTGAPGLVGAQGPKGSPGEAGPAGETVAYATVNSEGNIVAARSKNLTQAEIDSDIAAGRYCFTPSFPVNSVIVNAQGAFDGGEEDVIATAYVAQESISVGDCSGKILVSTFDVSSESLQDRAFTIWFED